MKRTFTYALMSLAIMGLISFNAFAQPSVSSVTVADIDTIVVEFDVFVTGATAGNTANYTLTPSNTIASIEFDSMNKTASLVTSLTSGTYYSLEVANIKDAGGMTMSSAHTENDLVFNTYNGDGIVITEILYNDSSGPDYYEFVEILNKSTASIAIGGLRMVEGATCTFPEYDLAVGEAVIIAKYSDSVMNAFGVKALAQFSGGLSNSGEDIDIRNSNDEVIDYVDFEDNTQGWDDRADGKGPSLQLEPHRINSDSNDYSRNWVVYYGNAIVNDWGTTYATPGSIPVEMIVPIGEVTEVDMDGNNKVNGARVAVSGTVYGVNMRSSGLQFTLMDNTGGISTIEFNKDWGYTVAQGDVVVVRGGISQYRGLTQIGNIDTVFKTGTATPVSPTIVNKPSEETENKYIQVIGVEVLTTDATWGGNKNYDVTNGTDTFTVRIDRDTEIDGEAIPSGKLDIVGIGGQFDASSPYTSGYQLLPQTKDDITASTGGPDPVIAFKGSTGSVDEAAGTYTLEVTLANANSTPTTVEVFVSQSTATLGTDYNFSSPQMVTFPANSTTTQNVIVTILNNATTDGDRTVEFRFQNQTNDAVFGADSAFLLTIMDDDLAVTQIQDITVNDAEFKPTTIDQRVRIQGVVYGVNLRSTGLQFTVIDNTGGVGIIEFSKDFGYTVREGDEVIVQGYVGFYNGLTQIEDLDTVIFDNNQSTPKNPLVVTELDETTESELVEIERVWFVNDSETEWPDNGNIDVTNGMDTFTLRIDGNVFDLAGQPTPIFDTMNVAGLGNQFDRSSPYNDGYQIFPRYAGDVTEWEDAGSIVDAEVQVNVYPNPSHGIVNIRSNSQINAVEVIDVLGKTAQLGSVKIVGSMARVNMTGQAAGVYFVRVNTEAGLMIQRISLK